MLMGFSKPMFVLFSKNDLKDIIYQFHASVNDFVHVV